MKNHILIKVMLVLPLIIFVDYVFMAVVGGGASILGFGESFYCGAYCSIGIGVVLASVVLFIFVLLPDLKKILTHKTHVEAS